MGLVDFEGFERLASVTGVGRYWSGLLEAGTLVNAACARSGGFGLGIRDANTRLVRAVPAGPTWLLGAAFKINTLTAQPLGPGVMLLGVEDGGTPQTWLAYHGNTQQLLVGRGDSTILATSTAIVSVGAWMYLEFLTTIHPSAGLAEARINGSVAVTFSGNTRNTANSQATTVRFGHQNVSLTRTSDNSNWDDLYVRDDTTYLGDCVVAGLAPTGAGASGQWFPTPSGTNWAAVDEAPANDLTDYVLSTTAGHRDLYAVGDVPPSPPLVVHGVRTLHCAQKSDAGARSFAPVVQSGATSAVGTPRALSTSWAYYSQLYANDPATAAAWTVAAVNAAAIGQDCLA